MGSDNPHPDGDPMGTEPSSPAPAGEGPGFAPSTAAALIGAIVAIVVVLALLFQGGGDSLPTTGLPAPTTTEDTSTSSASPELTADRPEIPPIDCNGLWGDDELVLALGSEERPYSQLGSFTFAQGETCIEELALDESYFIRVEPGDPSDFAPEAILNGQTNVMVADVGDAARWFGGADDGDAPTVLAVFEETPVGELFFRVSIGRPDLSPDEHLAVTIELAQAMLPNFPYVVVEPPAPPEPIVIEIQHDSVTPTESRTLDELVIDGEGSGDWTLGEGLVAALAYLSGEVSDFDPPAAFDVSNGSATGIMLMAIDYVENGSDAAMRVEVERFLAEFTFPEPPVDPTPDPDEGEGEDALGIDSGSFVLLGFVPAQNQPPAQEPLDCGLEAVWFEVDCTVVVEIGDVRFGYPRGVSEGTIDGWTMDDVDGIRAAIETSVNEYSRHGSLEKVDILLTPNGGPFGRGVPFRDGDRCLIHLNTAVQTLAADQRDFFVALELAGCFLSNNLPRETFRSYGASKWWFQGLASYLAAEAFPSLNIEWSAIDRLESSELSSSLQDRTVSNWAFFRSVAAHGGGPSAALGIVVPLTDAPTIAAQQDKLAAQSSSDPALHVFHQELSDGKIPDSGGAPRQYNPSASADIELTGTTIILDEPTRFGVTRYHLTVPSGMYACLEYDITGNVLSSWRTGDLGSGGGSWGFDLPEELTGEAVVVVTTVQEGESFGISAEVSDEPDCDEDEEDDPTDFELPDCGICDPSFYFRLFGAFLDALS